MRTGVPGETVTTCDNFSITKSFGSFIISRQFSRKLLWTSDFIKKNEDNRRSESKVLFNFIRESGNLRQGWGNKTHFSKKLMISKTWNF